MINISILTLSKSTVQLKIFCHLFPRPFLNIFVLLLQCRIILKQNYCYFEFVFVGLRNPCFNLIFLGFIFYHMRIHYHHILSLNLVIIIMVMLLLDIFHMWWILCNMGYIHHHRIFFLLMMDNILSSMEPRQGCLSNNQHMIYMGTSMMI